MLASETAFLEHTPAHLPPTPANHKRIVALNEAGTLFHGDHIELETGVNHCAIAG